jgi:phosphoglycerate dehydrogenase-like enzyme
LSGGSEHIDLDACADAGIEVVRPASASAQAEAEFVVGALLQMLRRVPVVGGDGMLVGRELGACTVGLVGHTATTGPLAGLLRSFGARVLGYDPALHATDPAWARVDVQPVGLRELLQESDAVALLLLHYRRFDGLFGARWLGECRRDQVWVSLAHGDIFDEPALARALAGGPLAAAWLDSVDPAWLEPGRPLANLDTLQVTPRLAATTAEARLRGAWAVARRIDEVLSRAVPPRSLRRERFRPSLPGDLADLEAG